MANPSTNFELIRYSGVSLENTRIKFRELYLRQIYGANPNQSIVIEANSSTGLGETAVNNWAIYDGPSDGANLVAHAQGIHVSAGNWYNSFVMLFVNDRFNKSTLEVMGSTVEGEDDWAIVGGTGVFAMARGVIARKLISKDSQLAIQKLTIDGFCHRKPTIKRNGPWGTNDGTPRDITQTPQRLLSVRVRSGSILNAISFTYVDDNGEVRDSGHWGDNYGIDRGTFTLGPFEYVKEISGTTASYENGPPFLSQFKIVTNTRTYGPFGSNVNTNSSFRYVVPQDETVVGFFAKTKTPPINANYHFVTTIGVYTI